MQGIFSPDPECLLYPAQTLAWEVRYLCTELLPHSETRLLPAGRTLLKSLWQEGDLSSLRKDEETYHCSELFIMLTREILLKDAIGVEELEGPCRLLHLDILFESVAFDTPTNSNLNETSLREPCADAQGPKQLSSVLRVIFSVMDAFEAALNVINPLVASDEASRERRHLVSQNSSAVKDLTMDKYRKILVQKLAQADPLTGQPALEAKKIPVTFWISSGNGRESIIVAPRQVRAEFECEVDSDAIQREFERAKWVVPQASTIEEVEDGWDIVDFDSRSCSGQPERDLPSGFPRRFWNRFPLLSRVLVKKKGA
ncbi:hypothetical protein EI94DRAFT_1708442 [Lactarius quietus]|nr:hypothetical protein EI94DRAFT_1708442 [Lactarius quietus]